MTDSSSVETATSPLPDLVVDRPDIQETLQNAVVQSGRHLVLSGPHGTGKTLFVRHLLDNLPAVQPIYIPCIRCDTQYKMLQRTIGVLTGDEVNSGHHTAHLHKVLRT